MAKEKKEANQLDAPGAFRSDGSWNWKAFLGERGHIDSLVRALVKDHRAGSLSPEKASRFILAANGKEAFPNVEQWSVSFSWSLCWASTSAESAVIREGRSTDKHHWCGEKWAPGEEHDCHEPIHRVRLKPEQVREIIAAAALKTVPDVTVYREDES